MSSTGRVTFALAVSALAACSSSAEPAKVATTGPIPVDEPAAPAVDAPRRLTDAELCPAIIASISDDAGDGPLLDVWKQHCPTWPERVRRCHAHQIAQRNGESDDPPDERECADELDDQARAEFDRAVRYAVYGAPTCDSAITGEGWLIQPIPDDRRGHAHATLRRALTARCTASAWSDDVRICIEDARAANARHCLSELATDELAAIDALLAIANDLYARAALYADKDKRTTCAKVAAAHYGDASWKGKLTGVAAGKRKQTIKDARAALERTCTDDKWSAFARGCAVAAKTATDRAWCLDEVRWSYPPAAPTTGIPECDEYVATMETYLTCGQIPQVARDGAKQALEAMRQSWNNGELPEEARRAIGDACKMGSDAIRQATASLGCTP